MTHCEKCISYDMCNYEYEHQDTDAILTFFPNNTDCPWFKNKADFVEVVKCGECAFREECNKEIYVERSYTSIDWCSEGKKKWI